MEKNKNQTSVQQHNFLFDKIMFDVDLLIKDDPELPKIFKIINQKESDLNIILSRALYIEYVVDKLLKAWIPGYKELEENKDFTFSLKIELLRSFRFMPNYILNNADLIRKIRNEVAHNIEINKIEKVPKKYLSKLNAYLKESLKKDKKPPELYKDKFILLSNITVLNLTNYESNIKRLNETIREKSFIENLYEINLEIIKKTLPIKKEKKESKT